MAAVRSLCTKGLLLKNGNVTYLGETELAISNYLGRHDVVVETRFEPRHTDKVHIVSAALKTPNRTPVDHLSLGGTLVVEFEALHKTDDLRFSVTITRDDGVVLANVVDVDCRPARHGIGRQRHIVTFEDIRLYPAQYFVSLWCGSSSSGHTYVFHENCLVFRIADGGRLASRSLPTSSGAVFLTPEWLVIPHDAT